MTPISLARLNTCHPDLQRLVLAVAKHADFYVLCGYRDEISQEMDFANGTTKAHFGQSPHNYQPSLAVDLGPSPLNWNDRGSFLELAKIVIAEAALLKIPITWGGSFQTLKDLPHFEITPWRKMIDNPGMKIPGT